jgi:SAM-dependent methyltransferase
MTLTARARALLGRDAAYRAADALFLPLERRELGQNRNLRRIPLLPGRKGGTHTVSEWAYTIGLFQSVFHQTVGQREQLDVLDVGCGTGRLSIAAAPLLGASGRYVGVDINADDINFCRRHYQDPRISFVHLEHSNRSYAPGQTAKFTPYPFEDASFDLATGLSVWTHLNEADALFYGKEVARCLRPGGKAVITFFSLDEDYQRFLQDGINRPSEFSLRDPGKYRFDQSVDGSRDWLCPAWVPVPESAIGVTSDGLDRLQDQSGLRLLTTYRGQWKNAPGLFFQDVLVFEKGA